VRSSNHCLGSTSAWRTGCTRRFSVIVRRCPRRPRRPVPYETGPSHGIQGMIQIFPFGVEMPGRYVAAARTFRRNWSGVKFKRPSDSPGNKKARRGFYGFYGDDVTRAPKAAVAMLSARGAEPAARERWFTGEGDVRTDAAVGGEILRFVQAHGAKPVVATDRIIGCPHEEGVADPEGKACPHCPFWAHRDRWTGDRVQ